MFSKFLQGQGAGGAYGVADRMLAGVSVGLNLATCALAIAAILAWTRFGGSL